MISLLKTILLTDSDKDKNIWCMRRDTKAFIQLSKANKDSHLSQGKVQYKQDYGKCVRNTHTYNPGEFISIDHLSLKRTFQHRDASSANNWANISGCLLNSLCKRVTTYVGGREEPYSKRNAHIPCIFLATYINYPARPISIAAFLTSLLTNTDATTCHHISRILLL